MAEIIAIVKKSLPNVGFDLGAFAYINTSGGRMDAHDARIRKRLFGRSSG
ncbi:MAG: hypothetical protein M3Y08_14960 [Fibrobacterota bacterium]|nr:hypothetical protein [Fibrobacterota bacterium]